MTTPQRRSPLSLAVISVMALGAGASSQAPSSDLAWPRAEIADPAGLGFTKAGLDALDARMKQAVSDGDTAGMTYLLLRLERTGMASSSRQESIITEGRAFTL